MRKFFARTTQKKFEYEVDSVHSFINSLDIKKMMNLRGSEGWELVSATKNQSNDFCFYWKRSIK